jgi:hypothetical protein
MQRYINKIMLTATFSIVHDKNQTKAQKAGLIDVSIVFLCKYSQIRAHQNGHRIKPIGQKNIQTSIHIMHHRFHRLVHQNFLVHSIGK